MAKTDLETLVVRMEAQMKAFENELKRGRQAADRETRAIERRFADANKRIASSFSSIGPALTRGLGFLGVGLGANELVKFADQFTRIQNALKVTGLEGEALTRVYDQLFASAQKNAAPLQALATLYGRASLVQNELKVSTEELLQFTDRVALALRVSGQSAEQSSGALLQLSQALGSGVVRAEEFNSILEGALPIAQAAARGILEAGGSVAKLRGLIVEGKVSSEAFFRGFQIGSATLVQQADKMEMSIGQAFTQFQNVLTDTIGRINKETGASKEIVRALGDLSEGVRKIADGIVQSKGQFSDFVQWLRDVDEAAQSAARYIGEVTGAIHIGPEVKSQLGLESEEERLARIKSHIARLTEMQETAIRMVETRGTAADQKRLDILNKRLEILRAEQALLDKSHERTGITAPDLDLTGGIPGLTPVPPKPVSINDFKPPTKPGSGKSTVGVDSFERAIASAEKRIAVQQAETAAINEGAAARERARIVAELQAAAIAANTAAGLKNTEVTAAQNVQIQATADKMYAVAQAAEAANGPMASAARSALDLNTNLQNIAVGSVDNLASSIADVASGTETASEAFRKMARSILRDLSQMILKAALWKAVSGFMGGGASIGGGPEIGVVGSAGGIAVPTFMAGGGQVRGPGTSTSDSILARLSDGEFVVKASAARQHRDLLEMINSGIPRFARGGPVGASGGRPVIGGVVVHNYGAEVQTDRREDGTTEITVRALTRDEQASPRMFGTMRSKYGISPQLVQR